MSNVRKAKHGWIFTIIFTILSVLWDTSNCNRIYELL